jgi:anti-anti-sigma factor
MELDITHQGSGIWIRLAGDLHRGAAIRLRQELDHILAEQPVTLSLDLSGVTSIGAASLRPVYDAFIEVSRWGGEMRLCGASASVRSLLDFVGFPRILPVIETCESGTTA